MSGEMLFFQTLIVVSMFLSVMAGCIIFELCDDVWKEFKYGRYLRSVVLGIMTIASGIGFIGISYLMFEGFKTYTNMYVVLTINIFLIGFYTLKRKDKNGESKS